MKNASDLAHIKSHDSALDCSCTSPALNVLCMHLTVALLQTQVR